MEVEMSALDTRIERVVMKAIIEERKRTREVLGQVLGELMADINEKLGKTADAADEAGAGVRELFARGPDQNGIVRRQFFTPRNSGDAGVRHG
jgi:hypothetical protein